MPQSGVGHQTEPGCHRAIKQYSAACRLPIITIFVFICFDKDNEIAFAYIIVEDAGALLHTHEHPVVAAAYLEGILLN